MSTGELLEEIRSAIEWHARPDLQTAIAGLRLSRIETAEPHESLTEPVFVVMAQGGKRLLLGDEVFEYRAGDYLLVTTEVPVSGHFIDASRETPALALGFTLRPAAIAPLLLDAPGGLGPRADLDPAAVATGVVGPELLDAFARMLRLLDAPRDAPVLAPMIEREILWRLITGPSGGAIRQIGLADSSLAHISRAIRWIRANYAEPMRIEELARRVGMSPSAFHRHFRSVTAMSPLQFQKRIRLQEARAFLVANPDDVAGVGHLVGYGSPSQFNREYRRQFGAPPGVDAARLRAGGMRRRIQHLP